MVIDKATTTNGTEHPEMKSKVHETTACAGSILQYFGIEGVTWNNRTKKNVWAATLRRNGYAVRSRASRVKRGSTAGSIRGALAKIAAAEPQIEAFVVRVPGHVLLMDTQGRTLIDTAPRQRDRRTVTGLYAIRPLGWKRQG